MGIGETQLMATECPRCGAHRVCSAGMGKRCACADVQLSSLTLDFLQKTHYSCLCNTCLLQYEKWVLQASIKNNAASQGELEEGTHFYTENGKWVFTPVYHIQRGYCCQSGCRHCPYGFDAKQEL